MNPTRCLGPLPQEPSVATYKVLPGERAPQTYAELDAWLASRTPVRSVNMLGGDFWLVSQFRPDRPVADWVVTFDNTYYQYATMLVLGDDGLHREFETGADSDINDVPRGTAAVALTSGHRYAVVIHVTSMFFTAMPRIDVQTRAQYHQRRTNESALMLGSLGVLFGLGVFILFVGFVDQGSQLHALRVPGADPSVGMGVLFLACRRVG